MRRRRVLDGLDEDIREHLDREIQDHLDRGLTPEEARRRALIAFGSVALAREDTRAVWARRWLDYLRQDVRDALRALRKQPAFTAAVVLTLTLGTGANAAIFSLVDSLLLRPLPVRDPQRLAIVTDGPSVEQGRWTYAIWEHIAARAGAFAGALAWSTQPFTMDARGERQTVNGLWLTGGAFDVLGITPSRGRAIMPADDRRGGGPNGAVAVLGHAFWQRQFGGSDDVIGRSIRLDGIPFTIVGVAPPRFFGLEVGQAFDVAVPLGTEPLVRGERESWVNGPDTRWLSIMVRLRSGQSFEQATLVLRDIQPRIRETVSAQGRGPQLEEPLVAAPAATGRSMLRRDYARSLLVLMAVVTLVLLMACVNLANLLLARATARGHEWAVRLALGAGRGRLARQVLTESVILAAAGGAGGLIVALAGGRFLVRQLSTGSVFLDLTLDWRLLGFTGGIALLTALFFGLAPALRAARGAPVDALHGEGRGQDSGGRGHFGSGLVIVQIVLSLILATGAALFLRTFSALDARPLGFDPDRVLVVGINTQRAGIPPEGRVAAIEAVRTRVQAMPGVAETGLSLMTPVSGAAWGQRIEIPGQTLPEDQSRALFNAITPGWLAVYGTRLVAGRDFTGDDVGRGAPVALVNETFARVFMGGHTPIGRVVRTDGPNPTAPAQIVGVVADAVYLDPRETPAPTIYWPLSPAAGGLPPTLSVRASSGPPAALASGIAAAAADVNPAFTLTFRPLAQSVDRALARERLLAMLGGFFGGLALLLAAVGLYGVTSYAVGRRRKEIAVRLALGATRASIRRLVLGRVGRLIAAGVLAGTAISLWAGRYVAPLLYDVRAHDPWVLACSATVLTIVGAIAGWLPARRAARLEPARVLSEG